MNRTNSHVPKRPRARLAALAALAALASTARAAEADDGWALSRFEPAPAGDWMTAVPSPFTAGHLAFYGRAVADYAHNPLVLRNGRGESVGAVVSDRLLLHVDAGLALFRRVTVDVNVPLVALQTGDDPSADGLRIASPEGAALGDVRLGARARLFGEYDDPLQIAVGASLWLPTGSRAAYASDGAVRAMPQAIVGGQLDMLVWSVALGAELRPSQPVAGSEQGTMLQGGGGVGFLFADKRLQLGPELNVAIGLEDPGERTFNAEARLHARYRVLPYLEAGLGAGPGLGGGTGTPDFRGLLTIAYAPEPPAAEDRDRDGIADARDACPDVPGVHAADPARDGCPAARQAAREAAAEDACPDLPGVQGAEDARRGCAADKDGDGIADARDACPELAGAPSEDAAKNGCPTGDRDEDGIPDAFDSCPDDKGFPSAEPENNGCPRAVRVTRSEVLLLQQIQFEFDQATIRPVSQSIVDEVAQALRDHPEILSVEVQGHTDELGTAEYNKRLSQRRADSVRQALIARGIQGDRLSAKGYGREVPLDNNDTDDGRQKNRRVEFKIVQVSPRKTAPGKGDSP